MSPSDEQEILREMARKVATQLPKGVFYALCFWAPGAPETSVYFSNAHKAESTIVLENLLGKKLEK